MNIIIRTFNFEYMYVRLCLLFLWELTMHCARLLHIQCSLNVECGFKILGNYYATVLNVADFDAYMGEA
jgi:hypothetical protein